MMPAQSIDIVDNPYKLKTLSKKWKMRRGLAAHAVARNEESINNDELV